MLMRYGVTHVFGQPGGQTAIWYALDKDPFKAAGEAAYEASAAIENLESVLTALNDSPPQA
jgi:hypothetical protein